MKGHAIILYRNANSILFSVTIVNYDTRLSSVWCKVSIFLFRQLRTSSSDFRKIVSLNVYKILYIYNCQYNKGDSRIFNSLNSTRSHSNSYILIHLNFNSLKIIPLFCEPCQLVLQNGSEINAVFRRTSNALGIVAPLIKLDNC